jgi:hypothetical protein
MATPLSATNQSDNRLGGQIAAYIQKAVKLNISKYYLLARETSKFEKLSSHVDNNTVPNDFSSFKPPKDQLSKTTFLTLERIAEIDSLQQQAVRDCQIKLLQIRASRAMEQAQYLQADFDRQLQPVPTREAISKAFHNELTDKEITDMTSEIIRVSKIKIGDIKARAAEKTANRGAKMDTTAGTASAAATAAGLNIAQLKAEITAHVIAEVKQQTKNQSRVAAGAPKHGQQRANINDNESQQEQRGRQQSASVRQSRSFSQTARGDGNNSRASSVKRGGDNRGFENRKNNNNSRQQKQRTSQCPPQQKQTKHNGKKKKKN